MLIKAIEDLKRRYAERQELRQSKRAERAYVRAGGDSDHKLVEAGVYFSTGRTYPEHKADTWKINPAILKQISERAQTDMQRIRGG